MEAFATPGLPGEPFLLDMATTTVAAGKIRNKANENLPTPVGWLVKADGSPSTDPREVSKGGFMTPLGGTPEGSSHKGYGLSGMVNILSSALAGASDGVLLAARAARCFCHEVSASACDFE